MAKFGCPAKFIAMVQQFHDGMLARVQNDGQFSDPFPVTNGVKQGCVLASTLFNMMFSAMLTDAFQDGDNGILIRYRFDGKLFNLRRLQAKSKVQTEVLDEFFFADDMANGAPTKEKMQKGVDQVSDSCDSYDFTFSIKKTEVVYQPAPGKPYKEPTITVQIWYVEVRISLSISESPLVFKIKRVDCIWICINNLDQVIWSAENWKCVWHLNLFSMTRVKAGLQ